ncbi:hypothetical protein HK101_003958, partial [Irineochytrium annulatum]
SWRSNFGVRIGQSRSRFTWMKVKAAKAPAEKAAAPTGTAAKVVAVVNPANAAAPPRASTAGRKRVIAVPASVAADQDQLKKKRAAAPPSLAVQPKKRLRSESVSTISFEIQRGVRCLSWLRRQQLEEPAPLPKKLRTPRPESQAEEEVQLTSSKKAKKVRSETQTEEYISLSKTAKKFRSEPQLEEQTELSKASKKLRSGPHSERPLQLPKKAITPRQKPQPEEQLKLTKAEPRSESQADERIELPPPKAVKKPTSESPLEEAVAEEAMSIKEIQPEDVSFERTIMFFHDMPDAKTRDDIVKQVKAYGSRVVNFFARNITHLVTGGPLPPGGTKTVTKGKKADKTVEQAIEWGVPVLTLEELRHVIAFISKRHEATPRKLEHLIREEEIYGPSTSRRHDATGFQLYEGYYFLCEDLTGKYQPIHNVQWIHSKDDPIDLQRPPWPKLYWDQRQGKCPFVAPRTAGVQKPPPVNDLNSEVDEDDPVAGPNGGGKEANAKKAVPAPKPALADSNASGIVSTKGGRVRPPLQAEKSLKVGLLQKRTVLATARGGKVTAGAGVKTGKENNEKEGKAAAAPVPVKNGYGAKVKLKVAFYDKSGYCENCGDCYDRYSDHCKTQKHRDYANDDANFVVLDQLIGRIKRRRKLFQHVEISSDGRGEDDEEDEDEDEEEVVDEDNDEDDEDEGGHALGGWSDHSEKVCTTGTKDDIAVAAQHSIPCHRPAPMLNAIKLFVKKDPDVERRREKYKILKKLGEGTYGLVREAIYIPTGQVYAMKSIRKNKMANNQKALQVVEREMHILQGLEPHRNVISMFEFFETKDKYYMVFELATGGELFDRIAQRGKFTERDAADIVFEILDGLSYLHAHGIVHRDLKPENILYKSKDPLSDIVIADFGVANVVNEDEMLRTLCGSPAYAAPEVIRRTGHGRPADVWSVGVIAFTLLMGYGPWYYCEDLPSMFDAITNNRWKFESPYVDNVSQYGRTFIKKLMQQAPAKRPTARQAMIDPWLIRYSTRANLAAKKLRDMQLQNPQPTPGVAPAKPA